MTETKRPPDQFAADVASTTLAHLARIDFELRAVEDRFAFLGRYLLSQAKIEVDASYDYPEKAHELLGIASVVQQIRSEGVKNLVRDLASRLPIRGVDFATGEDMLTFEQAQSKLDAMVEQAQREYGRKSKEADSAERVACGTLQIMAQFGTGELDGVTKELLEQADELREEAAFRFTAWLVDFWNRHNERPPLRLIQDQINKRKRPRPKITGKYSGFDPDDFPNIDA